MRKRSAVPALAILYILMGPNAFAAQGQTHPTVVPVAVSLQVLHAESIVPDAPKLDTPIQHVVIIDMENHSFDNVLGQLCYQQSTGQIVRPGVNDPCNGAISGLIKKPTGDVSIPLSRATDFVANVKHDLANQILAMDGGAMDNFNALQGCTKIKQYACYTQYYPDQIPNVELLAESFAIGDAFFETNAVASWGSHVELVSGTMDGFTGDNPTTPNGRLNHDWGCGAGDKAYHLEVDGSLTMQYTCIIDPYLDPIRYPYGGAKGPTTVQPVPSLMDEATAAGISWREYADMKTGFKWAPCADYASCIYTSEKDNFVEDDQLIVDAQNGDLAAYSLVTPSEVNSQHNYDSMLVGDNWIGSVIQAIEQGPQWSSTAVFLTWDDCGCFYDHAAPPTGSNLGIRVPLIAISPYAKAGFTDSNVGSYDSLARYAEEVLGIPSMGGGDATAYDLSNMFDYTQPPLRPVPMGRTSIPKWEWIWLANHPADADDPT